MENPADTSEHYLQNDLIARSRSFRSFFYPTEDTRDTSRRWQMGAVGPAERWKRSTAASKVRGDTGAVATGDAPLDYLQRPSSPP